MLTLLIFPGGRRADAVLLSANESCLRLAVAGRTDVLELNSIGGRWVSDTGVPVEFGAMIAPAMAGEERKQPYVLTAAGRPC
jgi:hypothetical protein